MLSNYCNTGLERRANEKARAVPRNIRVTARGACQARIWDSNDALVKSGLPRKYWIMQAVQNPGFLNVEDYLTGEKKGDIRHEYIGGVVYVMAGAGSRHNTICLNLAVALRSRLRGKPCQVFMVDIKVKLRIADEDIFYYPDLMVTCDPRDQEEYFKCFPRVLIEVLSPATERIDRREKFSSYTRMESLEEYVLVAQDQPEVTVFRRSENWRSEVATQRQQQLRIPALDFTLSLSAIYEGALPPD